MKTVLNVTSPQMLESMDRITCLTHDALEWMAITQDRIDADAQPLFVGLQATLKQIKQIADALAEADEPPPSTAVQ